MGILTHLIKNVNYRILIQSVFVLGIFISAFVYWPQAEIEYEIPKVWFVLRWIEIMGLISLILGTFYLKKQALDRVLNFSVLLFVTVAFTASYFGVDFDKSLAGNYYRHDGLLTLVHFTILFFVISLFSDDAWILRFVKAISSSSVFLGLWVVADFIKVTMLNLPVDNWYGAYGGPFGNPNFLAGYLVVTLPATAYLFTTAKLRVLKLITLTGLFVQLVGISLTYAWAGVFGIIIFIFGWGYLAIPKLRLTILFSGFFAIVLLSFVFVLSVKKAEVPNRVNAEGRERIFIKGIGGWIKRPILGYGWSNFDYAFQSVNYPIRMDDDVYVDKAHSSFLEILVTTGIIGLVIYGMIILKTAINLYRRQEKIYKYLLFGFILTILHMQTNVISISEELVFWTTVGFASKKDSKPQLSSLKSMQK